jgi:hypothetical protein
MYLLEVMTAFAGAASFNAFDHPGVEEGKTRLCVLGKPGSRRRRQSSTLCPKGRRGISYKRMPATGWMTLPIRILQVFGKSGEQILPLIRSIL